MHATHASAGELAGIAASGAVVGLCPITEASLGDGIFPAAAFLGATGRIGVGSDSNVRLDAAEELRLLEYSQRLILRARNVLALREGASTGAGVFAALSCRRGAGTRHRGGTLSGRVRRYRLPGCRRCGARRAARG